MGKLMSKVSPRKSKLIVKLSLMPRKVAAERKKRSDALIAEEVQKIQDFYRRDDISRMCPGRKDFVSVKTDRGREHIQKRVLICNLKEVHQMFCAENSIKVSFSKFCSLRPEEVVLTVQKGQEVCQCEYHENIEMCVEGLSKAVVSLPKSAREALEMTVCSMENENCVDRKCTDCGVAKLDGCFKECDDEMEVSYRKWTKDGIIKKELIQTDAAEAKQDLYTQMETFARHVYNVKRQHTELKCLKENIADNHVIIQEDFAENYTLRQQNEIMAAHWAPQQVTIFTAVVYYKENNELKSVSYCIISDELDHNKHSVFVFNKLIINDLVTRLGSNKVQHIYYWSDGCGSQFKNKYTFSNLLFHEHDFGCTAEWNFFETSHGKGPVDGIGGAVKRSVWRCTMQGKDCPMDAKNFFEIANRESKSVTVIYASKEEVRKTASAANLDDRWAVTKPIPGTRRFHQFKPSQSDDQLVCSVNSSYTQMTKATPINETSTDAVITTGDYILVEFKAKKSIRNFVGQVCVNKLLIGNYSLTVTIQCL